jgi:hypothetical protein
VITLASHTKEDGWEEYTVRKKVSKLEKMMPRWGKKKKKKPKAVSLLWYSNPKARMLEKEGRFGREFDIAPGAVTSSLPKAILSGWLPWTQT